MIVQQRPQYPQLVFYGKGNDNSRHESRQEDRNKSANLSECFSFNLDGMTSAPRQGMTKNNTLAM